MAKHALFSRAAYQIRSFWNRLKPSPDLPGVSILLVTWNRPKFLDLSLQALADTIPDRHEVLVWINGSEKSCESVLSKWKDGRLKLRVFESRENIGTSGFAALALRAKHEILFEMDDDIFLLPRNWYEKIVEAFQVFPEVGYLALDVVQDEYTNGAKPVAAHYKSEARDGVTMEFGPTGGWATATLRKFYLSTEGFPFRPHKPYFSEDGYYRRVVENAGKRCGILSGVKAYHASGELWSEAFGYPKLVTEKHASHGAPQKSELVMPEIGKTVPAVELLDRIRQAMFAEK